LDKRRYTFLLLLLLLLFGSDGTGFPQATRGSGLAVDRMMKGKMVAGRESPVDDKCGGYHLLRLRQRRLLPRKKRIIRS
jgi:hypothetical protein